ncbi:MULTISPECIES: hypothetical protein [Kitasatospora]|uniref:Lipoprotein n=1 Tax=Kitasatospora setae (strain ATCC 33774 / DSM 43861 / JCM 3304 / KCC A-0304 / NBRC 14216 / KM-6054) TaxID=452652 RepID=E4NC97_KITSK|nr:MULTISPECIES: hypothetical protein [Kitasatospora]BAJ28828.1 hypothetical protein KSE_30160 [Kitasatospora setae KM-6054]
MTARRTLALLAGALLAPALLTGCGIRATEVPVDAGAPASRTACPNELQVPMAPEPTDPPTPQAAPTPTRSAATGKPAAAASGSAASASASPTPAVTATGGAFVAPSPSHCP